MYNFFFKSINKCSSESKWNENKVDDENQWTEMVKLTHKIQQKNLIKKEKRKKARERKNPLHIECCFEIVFLQELSACCKHVDRKYWMYNKGKETEEKYNNNAYNPQDIRWHLSTECIQQHINRQYQPLWSILCYGSVVFFQSVFYSFSYIFFVYSFAKYHWAHIRRKRNKDENQHNRTLTQLHNMEIKMLDYISNHLLYMCTVQCTGQIK